MLSNILQVAKKRTHTSGGLSTSFAKFFRRKKATAEGVTTSGGRDQREATQKVSDVTVSPLSPGESGSHGEESLPEALTVGTTSC